MDKCIICGSPISENNPDGIGFGCRENIVIPTKRKVFHEAYSLELWIRKAQKIRALYVETFKDTKFRSEFKKSFYQSMTTAERISKKQLEIMTDHLSFGHSYELDKIDAEHKKYKDVLFEQFNPSTHPMHREVFDMFFKAYFKKGQPVEA